MSIRKAQDERIEGTPDGLTAVTEITDVPDTPTIGAATDLVSGGGVSVAFTPAATGGTATTYTATSTPSSITGSAASSPITVTGLTLGTAYTFTVSGSNATGTSPASAASSPVTPTTYATGYMDALATVTVGSGGASSLEFTAIPSTYTHLQIRLFVRPTSTSNGPVFMQCNLDTSSNYSRHAFRTDGSTLMTSGQSSQASMYFNGFNVYAGATDRPTISIIDILDYTNTSKYKVVKTLAGLENNGSGEVGLYSGMWLNTDAINSIKLFDNVNYGQYTSATLYGIKG